METFLILVHLVVCLVLILVVLLQSGKAADLAGAFGGGGSQTALGSRGAATFLTKATTTSAVLFMLTSLGLALLGSRQASSVLESAPPPVSGPASAGEGPAGSPAAAPADGASPESAAPAPGAPEGQAPDQK
jgi:preprotein translocase subunit SecG